MATYPLYVRTLFNVISLAMGGVDGIPRKCLNQKTLPAGYTFWGIFSIPMCNRFLIWACLPPKTAFLVQYWPKNGHLRGINAWIKKRYRLGIHFGLYLLYLCAIVFWFGHVYPQQLHFGSNMDPKTAILGGYNAWIKKRCRLGIHFGG